MSELDSIIASFPEDEQSFPTAVEVARWNFADKLVGLDVVKSCDDFAERNFSLVGINLFLYS